MEEIKSMLTAILENQQVTNAKLDALTMDVRRLEGRVTKVDERLTKVEERVTKIEERVTKIEERLTKVEEKVAKIEERLTKVEERVAKIEEKATKIEETMAKKEDVFEVNAYLKHLAQKTGEHDMEIKVLKDIQLQLIFGILLRLPLLKWES